MAWIWDHVTEEQLADLEQADVEFIQDPVPLGWKKNSDFDYHIGIRVEQSVNELLSPPLCPSCGTKMDSDYHPDQAGGTMYYWCPACRESLRIIRSRE